MPDPTDFGERAFSVASNLFNQGKEVAKREARVIRLQTQISRLRSHRQRLLVKMGEKVFDLFERDLVKNQDLRMMSQQIKTIDADIALRREEIDGIRAPGAQGEAGIDHEPGVSDVPADLIEDEIIRD
jgi:hypothetical protein